METRFLHMPQDRYSFVEFLIKTIANWYDYDCIFFDKFNYVKLSNSHFINRTSACEECYIDGITSPPLFYQVKQVKFDLWEILWIEVNGKRYNFSKKPSAGTAKSLYICS